MNPNGGTARNGNRVFSTLQLTGGLDCKLERPWSVDLFVRGGALIQKTVCI